MPVAVVAPVGHDAAAQVHELVAGRDIVADGIDVLDKPTYRWNARQVEGHNLDLGGADSIYDGWEPRVPEDYAGWAFVGSMRLDRQLAAAQRLTEARLLAGDSMRSYVLTAPAGAQRLLSACDWFFCNQDEFAALAGNTEDPAAFVREHDLRGLCMKRGAGGAAITWRSGGIELPALPAPADADTTGAGDSLAGGFLARWLSGGGREEDAELRHALATGIACATVTIGSVGLRGIAKADRARVEELTRQVLA